ncbi:GDSL-like lipase/Acylhydrolase family protein [Hirsutella rhossiliensis]|uniref:GDSL-like lipase/Acylhydrolase family domain-containing protein n=1 Tax=Hirsutella rhossiliensis TaxID=111463 RepID=A0A9P8SE06_9HYPO|nr:GDSL-like lipase/Acylhydrolase family domain-containing protein [Hirsutella rhossiliensis]KAH0958489.1 GDSL-like lipase/Acylhydrolase family domain-containing protein [Hirsutella rhossiliensis]
MSIKHLQLAALTGGSASLLFIFLLLGAHVLPALAASGIITAAAPIKIMPLGDSITYGRTGSSTLAGYRGPLFALLQQSGYHIDFVGSMHSGIGLADPDNEGHPGITVRGLDSIVEAFHLVQNTAPQMILLHIGTNNMYNDKTAKMAPNDLTKLVKDTHAQAPNARILLASIIFSTDPHINARIRRYNQQVEATVRKLSGQGLPIVHVDMSKAITPVFMVDLIDKVHPNDAGYQKMAQVWMNALQKVLPKPKAKMPC